MCESSRSEDSDPRDSLNSLLESSLAGRRECTAQCEPEKRREICCSSVAQCVWGVLLLTVSIGGLLYTPLDLMLWEKLNMRPGFPPYEWWADPPDEVRLRAYVFNVTNHERFTAGLDRKLDVQELGPIVYLEKLLHSNIIFNDNSTLTYTAKRTAIFLPEENTLDLNATIFVPNLALLHHINIGHVFVRNYSTEHAQGRANDPDLESTTGARSLDTNWSYSHPVSALPCLNVLPMCWLSIDQEGISSYLHNAPYIAKLLFRGIAYKSDFFVQKTIYEYLWEFREPILDTSKSIVPGMVPVNNMGMLARIYADFTDEVTVKIGPQWGHQHFFQIDRFRGEPQLPGYDPDECPDRIFGSTEGVMYSQRLSKEDVLLYWRKTVCKLMPLYFDSEMTVEGVSAYRYNLSESVFQRVNGTDCYDTEPSIPAGLSDASKCYFDFPMVVSFPHFYTGGLPKDHFVTGLQPDKEKHNSYAIVEPLTGTPLRSVARMQSNLYVKDLSGFSEDYNTYSNLIIPLFWAEYNQEGLPKHILGTLYFMTVILPPLTTLVLTITLLLGCYIVFRQIYIQNFKNDSLNTVLQSQYNQNKALASTKWFSNEKQAFLKPPS